MNRMTEKSTISPHAEITASANEQVLNAHENTYGQSWKSLPIQYKLSVGDVDDPLEHEADAMADKVMRMPETDFIQRKCSHCEEEEKLQRKPYSLPSFIQRKCVHDQEQEKTQRKPLSSFIQKKSSANNNIVSDTISSQIQSTKGSGNPIPKATKTFMESHFGANFSNINIHTGSYASQLSNQLNAQAFTVGNDIYFNEGKYQPESSQGKQLLAHELTHTLQQNAVIKRFPKTDVPRDIHGRPLGFFETPEQLAYDQETYEIKMQQAAVAAESEILANSVYTGLNTDSKARVKEIIKRASQKPVGENKGQRNYYLKMLKIAITTPFEGVETGSTEYGCSDTAEKQNREEVEKALDIEKKWWEGSGFEKVEEDIVATGTSKTVRKGQGGKKFYVDRTDPKNIRVLMKVKLNGKAEEVASIKKLEDAIERNATTKGYHLDIVFINSSGPDVFEFTVSFCQWANSGNWASGPETLSHEVHHALGLGDRYDYIESHSDNKQMNVPMRLVWFLEQMKKATGPRDDYSKMSTNTNPLLAEDVCAVAFDPGTDRDNCTKARKDLDPAGVPPL